MKYWKKKDGYVENPKYVSQRQLQEERKFHKKSDLSYL